MTEFRYDTQLLIEGENLDGILCGTGGNFRYRGGGYGPAGARLKGLSGRPDKETGQTDIGYFRRL